jgi:hypothetical protein
MIPLFRFYFSLVALESILKEALHNQHNLKIAAAGSSGTLFFSALTHHGAPIFAMHSIA